MTTLIRLTKILAICAKYSQPETGICAEHDIIYLPLMNDAVLHPDDEKALEELHAWKSDVDSWAVYT